MRKTLTLSLLLLLQMIAVSSFAQKASDKTVTINMTDVTVKQLFAEVRKQTGLNFLYSSELSKTFPKVTVKAQNKPVREVLDDVMRRIKCVYEIDGTLVTVKPGTKPVEASGRTRKISGIVRDADGEPLVGVPISIGDGNVVAVTDANGSYTVTIPVEQTVLKYTYVGMETAYVNIPQGNKEVTRDVVMRSDSRLDEVVVTGYQSISRERTAGSYDIVKGKEIAQKASLAGDVLSGLEGLTTGLLVNNAYGQHKYTVRGLTSINSNQEPLYVVDGVPLEANQLTSLINDDDIESVTVLKDATAASIWGSRAANGVIVIKTKVGARNSKVHVSYNGSYTFTGKPDYGYLKMMDNETFMNNAKEVFDLYSNEYSFSYDMVSKNSGVTTSSYDTMNNPVVFPHERLMYQLKDGRISQSEYEAGINQLLAQDGRKSYEDNMMSDKMMTRHNISLSGGSAKQAFYLSLGYVGDQGISKDKSNRIAINLKEDIQLTNWLKWDVNVNASFGREKGKLYPFRRGYGDFDSSCTFYHDFPYASFYDVQGNAIDWGVYNLSDERREIIEQATGIDMSFYPVTDFNNSESTKKSTNVRVNTGITIDLLKGLKYEGRLQYSRFNTKQEYFYPQDHFLMREERLCAWPQGGTCQLPTSGGKFFLNNGCVSDWTLRNQLSYDAIFDEGNHQFTALVGTEVREYLNQSYNNMLYGYDIQTMKYVDYNPVVLWNGVYGGYMGGYSYYSSVKPYTQSESKLRYFSLYANAAYTYLSRYTLNASIRVDQSNLFGSDPSTQYKPIWSVGGAWKISDEAFMKPINWIDMLTLRLTYGFAGNSPKLGDGGRYDILISSASNYFEKAGMRIWTPANDKLTWEKTRTWNFGFDMATLNHRLNVSLNYYDKKTTDLIGNVKLNPTTGWANTTGNLGTMTNKGIELSLTSHNVKSKGFNWYTTLNFTSNKNEIVRYDVQYPYTAYSICSSIATQEGYPMGALFSYRYAGLDEKGGPQAYRADGSIAKGNTEIQGLTLEDVVYSGTIVPKYYGGLTNRFEFGKAWELSFMFTYNLGHKMRNQTNMFLYGRPTVNLYQDFDNRWRKPGDENFTDIPAYSANYDYNVSYNPYFYADTHILNASYIKLRDLSLTYNLPASFCSKFYAESAKITLQVGNLFYWAANDKGIDPEYYDLGGNFNNRQNKFGPSYSVSVNINF